jgi:hypothetical protein
MNWLSNFARPGLSKKKPEDARDTPDNLWIKDPLSGDLIYRQELEQADWVTPSGFHMRIGPDARFKQMFDDQAWQKITLPKVATDPLKFKDDKKYVDRLKSARAKVGRDDCMAAGYGRIGGAQAVVLVQDFEFMGGSLGMAAGEAFLAAFSSRAKLSSGGRDPIRCMRGRRPPRRPVSHRSRILGAACSARAGTRQPRSAYGRRAATDRLRALTGLADRTYPSLQFLRHKGISEHSPIDPRPGPRSRRPHRTPSAPCPPARHPAPRPCTSTT